MEKREGGKRKGGHEDTEHVDIEGASEKSARIEVGGGVTKNMGDFNSLRVDVRISLPCADDDKSLQKAYDRASKKVEEYIQLEMERAEAE